LPSRVTNITFKLTINSWELSISPLLIKDGINKEVRETIKTFSKSRISEFKIEIGPLKGSESISLAAVLGNIALEFI